MGCMLVVVSMNSRKMNENFLFNSFREYDFEVSKEWQHKKEPKNRELHDGDGAARIYDQTRMPKPPSTIYMPDSLDWFPGSTPAFNSQKDFEVFLSAHQDKI